MPVSIEWDDSYLIGISAIDQQHRTLLELAKTTLNSTNPVLFRKSFMALYKYTREHFATEEEAMTESNYPSLAEHKQRHLEIIDELNRLAEYGVENPEFNWELKKLLIEWVLRHIASEDKAFGVFRNGV